MYILLFNLFAINLSLFFYSIYKIVIYTKPKNLIILRGLPGSGKTQFINNFIKNADINEYVICSFLNHYDGNPRFLPKAYSNCFGDYMNNIISGNQYIFLDNPNIQKWEIINYINLAVLYDYKVTIYSINTPDLRYLEYFMNRSSFKPSFKTIKSMNNRWENFDLDDVTEFIVDPFVEVELSENGDCLPYPVKTKEELDIELDQIKIKNIIR